jgi:phytoene dehydrogenase-like protein
MNDELAVVGGGLAGLTAAIVMARAGQRVRLFERSASLGGRATTTEERGFELNLGPHALYRAGRGMAVLRELGVEVSGRIPRAAGFAVHAGVLHALPVGFVSMLSTSLLPLGAKLETASLLARIARLDATALDRVSVAEWVGGFSEPRSRELLTALIRLSTYSTAHDLLSAGAALAQLQLAVRANVLYLHHGWNTLVASLTEKARAAKVAIETEARVESVSEDGDAVRLGFRGGRTLSVGALVLALGPVDALRLVGATLPEPLAPPIRAACLDLGLDALPRPGAHFALGIDRPTYLSVHSATAELAPSGAALIHAARYLESDEEPQDAHLDELEALVDLVQPGWRERVVVRRFLPRLLVSHGLPLASRGGLLGRPTERVPGHGRVFFAGDWVGSEGQLADASLASGQRAATMALAAARAPTEAGRRRAAEAV